MRISNGKRWLLAAAILIGAAPAQADITARYSNPDGLVALTAEADAKGDVRISYGNQYAVLRRDDTTYVLMGDLSGPFAVRQDDWMAVTFGKMRQFMQSHRAESGAGKPSSDFTGPPFVIVQGGRETVGGRNGTVWSLRLKDEPAAQAAKNAFDFVVTDDPDLAPIGGLLAEQMIASTMGMQEMLGHKESMFQQMDSVFAKGTVIRFSRLLSLQSVDAKPVAPSEFELPATTLTREQYEARVQPGTPSLVPPLKP
jgi:hypothetical protein